MIGFFSGFFYDVMLIYGYVVEVFYFSIFSSEMSISLKPDCAKISNNALIP